ncbi:olfactory receptor 10AG1-like [Hyperolius riggenbachi]|uniref:olfactory receptor 10AG1-like n=1 Tax=Hyperolius riggenbachi TaxID=752182 RepID=UPI0035A2AB63
MSLIALSKNLHSPMYFYITQLSLLDIIVSTDITPNLLHIVLNDGGTMSLTGCFTQISFFTAAETSECLLLAVMSWDRYVAICKPLHYNSIISHRFCINSVIITWLLGFLTMMVYTISICSLYYCGPNMINHFFCDLEPLVKLSCSDASFIHFEILMICFIGGIIPFMLIVMSYTNIVLTILKIPSVTGRQKAFTTCSSHLIVVSVFCGTLIIVYIIPKGNQTLILTKLLSLFYTVITPLLNPIIYTIRNKDFMEAFKKIK